MRVKSRVRQRQEQRLQHVRYRRFADPAQRQAANGHSKLHGIEDMVELLMELLDGARADAMRRNHLLQSRLAHAHQSEFSGHEERVCRDQQDHCYDAQHDEGNHESEILTSRAVALRLTTAASPPAPLPVSQAFIPDEINKGGPWVMGHSEIAVN